MLRRIVRPCGWKAEWREGTWDVVYGVIRSDWEVNRRGSNVSVYCCVVVVIKKQSRVFGGKEHGQEDILG